MPVRPIINPDAPQIVKRDPRISFSQDTFVIEEKYLRGDFTFNWSKYLINLDQVGYTTQLTEGIWFVDMDTISWNESGQYTLTLTTEESRFFNSVSISMTLNIVAISASQVEYVPDPLEIVDGDLQIEYFNVEKRQGVYMFDLIKPENPNSLTINYKIEGKHGCTIDLDDAKVHIAKKGKYKITAYFEGNESFRPSETVYYLIYGQDGEDDGGDPYEGGDNPGGGEQPGGTTKRSPNLSFSKSIYRVDWTNTGIYSVIQVNNPYSVPVSYTSDKGNLFDGSSKIQVDTDFEGNVIITCTSQETSQYYSQTVSYVLTIEIPESEKISDYVFEFVQPTDNQTLNDTGEYPIIALNNPIGLEYTMTVSKGASISSDKTKLLTSIEGIYIIKATSIGGSLYTNKTTQYTLTIEKPQKKTPQFTFDKMLDTQVKKEDGKYVIQTVTNPSNLEYTLSTNSGTIQDNLLVFNDLGDVTITAVSKETDEYVSVTAYYILSIIKSSKQNPNISFTFDRINIPFKTDITEGYDIQVVNNPNGVMLGDYYASNGQIESGKLYNITSPVELYIQVSSIEDSTYYAATARYTLNIYSSSLKYPNFRVHEQYNLVDKLNITKNIELLRWLKSDNLSFNSEEWRVTSANSICVVNNLTMVEQGDNCVLYADVKFSQEGLVRLNISFLGNESFYTASNMGLYINYEKTKLLSPELSFPSYYVIQDKSSTNTYLIQEVLNPYSVPVNYYVSKGDLDGNILTYTDTGKVVVTCTSQETDTYSSQSVQYTLDISQPKKLSPELSFTNSLVQYEAGTYPANEYPLQAVTNPHNVPIKEWKATNQAIVYAQTSQTVKYNNTGDVVISVTSRETNEYYSQTVYYTMRIVESSSLLDPELYYSPNQGQVYVNEYGQYTVPLPHIVDSTLPLTFTTQGGLGTISSDGTTLSIEGTWNVRIYATFAGDTTYRAAQADYLLRIVEAPSKPYPDIYFQNDRVFMDSNNSNGVYDLQVPSGAQANIGGEYYLSTSAYTIDNSTKKLYCNDVSADIIVYYKTYETSDYKPTLIYYELLISKHALNYLEGELIKSNINVTGQYNEEIIIPVIKIKKEKNLEFDASEWKITPTKYGYSPRIVSITSFDSYYDVLNIGISFSQEDTVSCRISFLGNDTYYSQSDFNLVYITFTKAKISPNYTFNTDPVTHVDGTPGNKYKIASLINVPDSLDVKFKLDTQLAYIQDGYVYLYTNQLRDVTITAYNDETSEYIAYETSYSIHVDNVYEKWYTEVEFKDKSQLTREIQLQWDPYNNYIVELKYGEEADPTKINWSGIVWHVDYPATIEYIGDYKYKINIQDNNNFESGGQFGISFTLQETDLYYSSYDEAQLVVLARDPEEMQDLTYTMHPDYVWSNLTPGVTITDVLLMTYENEDGKVLWGDDVDDPTDNLFEISVNNSTPTPPRPYIGYATLSNLRYRNNQVIADVTLIDVADAGEFNIYVTYKGNAYYNYTYGVVHVTFNVDSQYVVENVIYVDDSVFEVEQDPKGNGIYQLQEIKYVPGLSIYSLIYYYEEPYCHSIWDDSYSYPYDVIAMNEVGDYAVHAYTYAKCINGVIYKASSVTYTFKLIENSQYYEDGSIYFQNSSETRDENLQHQYPLQQLVNPNMWTVEYTQVDYLGNETTITDGYIHYNDVGVITVYAKTVGVYPKHQAHYTLLIREAIGLDSGLSFPNGDVNQIISDTNTYIIDKPYNPNNVNYTLSSNVGTITQVGTNYYLNGEFYVGDVITISCSFTGDETYNAAYISYRITITNTTGSQILPINIYNEPGTESYPWNMTMSYQDTNIYSIGQKIIFAIPNGQIYNFDGYHKQQDWSIRGIDTEYTLSYHLNEQGIDTQQNPVQPLYTDMDIYNIRFNKGHYDCDYILPLNVTFKGTNLYQSYTFNYNILIKDERRGQSYILNGGPYFNETTAYFSYNQSHEYNISSYIGSNNIVNPNKLSYIIEPDEYYGSTITNGIYKDTYNAKEGKVYIFNDDESFWYDNVNHQHDMRYIPYNVLNIKIKNNVFNRSLIGNNYNIIYRQDGIYNLSNILLKIAHRIDNYNITTEVRYAASTNLDFYPKSLGQIYDNDGNILQKTNDNYPTFYFDTSNYKLETIGYYLDYQQNRRNFSNNVVGYKFIIYPYLTDSNSSFDVPQASSSNPQTPRITMNNPIQVTIIEDGGTVWY